MNDNLKDQALKACEDIYENYIKTQLVTFNSAVYRAWQAGKLSKMDARICTNLECNPKRYPRCLDFDFCKKRTT